MTNQEYHAAVGVSKSDLDLISRSPAHYQFAKRNPSEPTPAMLLGTAVHKLVLEPEDFEKEFIIAPECDRRTKEGKALYAEFMEKSAGKSIITVQQYNDIFKIASAVKNHPLAGKLLTGGIAEQSYFWEEDGVKCKCRPDYLRTDIKAMIDLKTARNASPESFTKAAFDYRYHVQAAWYLRGMKALGYDIENFIFITVETEAPYAVCVYAADELMIKLGNITAEENFKTICNCIKTDHWYSYDEVPEIHSLSLPEWIIRKYF